MGKLKSGFALAVLCTLALGIAACGGGSDSGSSSSTGSSGGDSAKLSGTVTVWDFEYETIPRWTEVMDALDHEFEELNPGVTVERVAQPYENWEAVYRAAFTAHEGPDAMLFQPGASGLLSFKDGLEVLNDRISPDLKEHLNQWESVTPNLTPDGEVYGIPYTTQAWVFYYNKDMFKKAGLPTDFEPKTWAEVREAGEKLKAAGFQPFTGGNKEGYENSWWFSVGFASENEPEQATELAEGKLSWTDPAIAKAFGPLMEMQEAGLYPSDRFSTPLFTAGYPRFAEEKGAMILGFWETIGYWGEFVPKLGEDNVGMFLPPGNNPISTLGNVAQGIPKFSDNKDAAYGLLEFMASKKGMETFVKYGYMPNRNDVSMPAKYPKQAHELEEANNSPERIVAPFLSAPTAVIWASVPREMNQVLQGRTSLESAQEAMQEAAEKES